MKATHNNVRWMDIETAPKDGTLIAVEGNNYGDEAKGKHYCLTYWQNGYGWVDNSDPNLYGELKYLTKWAALPPVQTE